MEPGQVNMRGSLPERRLRGAVLRVDRPALHAGWIAGVVFLAALAGFGAALAGYAQALHPVDLLGARGVQHAPAWNALGYAVPGLLVAVFAIALQRPLAVAGVGAAGRIGGWLLMLSGLAFAAQGLLPLDPRLLDGADSKAHVAAGMLSLLAWLPSALLLPLALRGRATWRAARVAGPLLAAAAIACLALPSPAWDAIGAGPGIAQRLGLCAQFAWPALAAFCALR
jgi:hypothetical protein